MGCDVAAKLYVGMIVVKGKFGADVNTMMGIFKALDIAAITRSPKSPQCTPLCKNRGASTKSCSVAIYWSKQTCTFAVSDSHVYAQQTASMHNWVHGNAVLMNRNC